MELMLAWLLLPEVELSLKRALDRYQAIKIVNWKRGAQDRYTWTK
jgi:hypothetical protein